jgi:hypothetical protein
VQPSGAARRGAAQRARASAVGPAAGRKGHGVGAACASRPAIDVPADACDQMRSAADWRERRPVGRAAGAGEPARTVRWRREPLLRAAAAARAHGGQRRAAAAGARAGARKPLSAALLAPLACELLQVAWWE